MNQEYSIDQPSASGRDTTTSCEICGLTYHFFNKALAFLHTRDLIHKLTKEQEAIEVLKGALKKVEKANRDLKETNKKCLKPIQKLINR